MNNQYIYLIITKTHTKFAKCLRIVGGLNYNHSAISLDAELNELYSFSRPQHSAVFLGHLVRETLNRYTLDKDFEVPVVVFQLPVSQNTYAEMREYIKEIMNDDEYMYNLFSVLTYPFTKGFATYKAFNCTEFAAHLLKKMGYPINHPPYQYKPDDFLEILKDYIVFEGDLRAYMQCTDIDENYLKHLSFKEILKNTFAMFKIIGRTYLRKI